MRSLDRKLGAICRAVAVKVAEGQHREAKLERADATEAEGVWPSAVLGQEGGAVRAVRGVLGAGSRPVSGAGGRLPSGGTAPAGSPSQMAQGWPESPRAGPSRQRCASSSTSWPVNNHQLLQRTKNDLFC